MEFFVQMQQSEYDKCIEELEQGAVNYSYAVRACEKVLKLLKNEANQEEED